MAAFASGIPVATVATASYVIGGMVLHVQSSETVGWFFLVKESVVITDYTSLQVAETAHLAKAMLSGPANNEFSINSVGFQQKEITQSLPYQ